MNSVLSTAVQTRRREKEYAAGWLPHVPEYRKAQDWKSREFIPSRRRIILWKCSLLMYNTAVINQKLCIYFHIECLLTCVSLCAMSTEFVSTTGSINPDESPQPLSMVWNVLLTGLLNICCGHAGCAIWDSHSLAATCFNSTNIPVRWFQMYKNKIPASKRHSTSRSYVNNGKERRSHSCWAYVSFHSLIHATRAAKQRTDRESQGAFRSFGRNASLAKWRQNRTG